MRTGNDTSQLWLWKSKAIEYEECLERIAELVKKVEAGQTEDTPEQGSAAVVLKLGRRNECRAPRGVLFTAG
jgi:coenzyme F420-reducing hydrogenase alpha subunit